MRCGFIAWHRKTSSVSECGWVLAWWWGWNHQEVERQCQHMSGQMEHCLWTKQQRTSPTCCFKDVSVYKRTTVNRGAVWLVVSAVCDKWTLYSDSKTLWQQPCCDVGETGSRTLRLSAVSCVWVWRLRNKEATFHWVSFGESAELDNELVWRAHLVPQQLFHTAAGFSAELKSRNQASKGPKS